MVKLTVDTHIRIDGASKRAIESLKSQLTKKNPTYQKLISMGKPVGDEPKFYEMFFEDEAGRFCIPRGTGRLARNVCRIYKCPVTEVVDDRFINEELIDFEMNFSETFPSFYSYQDRLIGALVEGKQGLGVAGCGSGKTVSGLGLIAKVKQPTMIVVHTKELLHQWLNEIKQKATGDIMVGQLGDGVRRLGDVTVALIQTLTRCNKDDWKKINSKVGMFIFDECHRAPAASYLKVLEQTRARYLIGLSATPKRKDGKHFLLYNYVGNILEEISDSEVQDAGRLVSARVEWVDTGVRVDFNKINQDWVIFSKIISKNMHRNRLIVENVKTDLQEGRFPMVLINRVKHAWMLTEMLRNEGLRVGVIIGDIDKDERKQSLIDAKAGRLDVLVCNSTIAGEGLDVPTLSALHVVFMVNNEGNLKQFVGRARRQLEGKEEAVIWDYLDMLIKTKAGTEIKHEKGNTICINRSNWYKKWGFTVPPLPDKFQKNSNSHKISKPKKFLFARSAG